MGYSVTADAANKASGTLSTDLGIMEAQARLSGSSAACDLAVRGRAGGRLRSFFYNKTTQLYRTDAAGEPELTRAQLLAQVGAGDALTFLGVQPGAGTRHGGDRDADGTLDASEPLPSLIPGVVPGGVRLSWPSNQGGWVLESSNSPQGPWQTVTLSRSEQNGSTQVDDAPGPEGRRFYRLRRTW